MFELCFYFLCFITGILAVLVCIVIPRTGERFTKLIYWWIGFCTTLWVVSIGLLVAGK